MWVQSYEERLDKDGNAPTSRATRLLSTSNTMSKRVACQDHPSIANEFNSKIKYPGGESSRDSSSKQSQGRACFGDYLESQRLFRTNGKHFGVDSRKLAKSFASVWAYSPSRLSGVGSSLDKDAGLIRCILSPSTRWIILICHPQIDLDAVRFPQ